MTTPLQKQHRKVLIVEDDTSLLRVLTDRLTQEGIKVLAAKNGKEGLAVALEEHPDLVLLDLIMPVMDGLTMLEKLRADRWGKNATVIILTVIADSQKVAQSTHVANYDFLVKSDCSMDDVVEKIKERLKL